MYSIENPKNCRSFEMENQFVEENHSMFAFQPSKCGAGGDFVDSRDIERESMRSKCGAGGDFCISHRQHANGRILFFSKLEILSHWRVK